MRISVNLKTLKSELERNKLTLNPGWSDAKAVNATASLNPTIVVVPNVNATTLDGIVRQHHGVARVVVAAGKGLGGKPSGCLFLHCAEINVPLWDAEKNRSYTLSNFGGDFRKFLRTQLGDEYKPKVTSMGQKILVIVE